MKLKVHFIITATNQGVSSARSSRLEQAGNSRERMNYATANYRPRASDSRSVLTTFIWTTTCLFGSATRFAHLRAIWLNVKHATRWPLAKLLHRNHILLLPMNITSERQTRSLLITDSTFITYHLLFLLLLNETTLQ